MYLKSGKPNQNLINRDYSLTRLLSALEYTNLSLLDKRSE